MIIILATKPNNELKDLIEILAEIKQELKLNEIAKDICNEYGFDTDIIDGISIVFEDDLGASAKTTDSKIQLSSNLLDEEFEVIMRYAVHELVHALQHMERTEFDPYENHDYLDRPDELEAFQYQLEYEGEARGEDKAEEYVNDLLEYHEIPDDEKGEKKEELLNKSK